MTLNGHYALYYITCLSFGATLSICVKLLHKHDKLTQCCCAFTLALARLSCLQAACPCCCTNSIKALNVVTNVINYIQISAKTYWQTVLEEYLWHRFFVSMMTLLYPINNHRTAANTYMIHTHTHTTVLLLFWNMSGTTRVSRYQKGKTRKVKTNLDLLEQEMVSGSGICWAICKPAPHPRQPRQHPTTQFFTGRMPFLPPNQQRQSTEGKTYMIHMHYITLAQCS